MGSPAGNAGTKFLSISFVRQIRLPRFAGEANLPDKTYGQELSPRVARG